MPDHFLAFWNVENLFGPEDHPPRIPWVAEAMAGQLAGWSVDIYRRKIAQLARIVLQMNGGRGPDILGVCEVEDAHVLADLAAALDAGLPGRSYRVIHADAEHDRRGIDTAFLYDGALYTADPRLVFNHFVLRRTGTRDILQASFRTVAGNELILLCNHWPARTAGGPHLTAGFRATAGETLGYWHERIREVVGPRAAVLAFGDFNDDPWDSSLSYNANATRERGDVERATSARLYNLAWQYLTFAATDHRGRPRVLDGTLYFRGDGNVFDQILVSRPLLDGGGPFDLADGSARVEAMPEMVSHLVGQGPIRFGLPRGNPASLTLDGYSDHFPVSVMLHETV